MKTLLILMTFVSAPLFAATLQVSDPWMRLPPPGTKVTAAFMELQNNGDQDVVVSKASSEHFDLIELHRTEMVNGVMKMVKQDKMIVKAKDKLLLKPKSWHLMLFQAKKSFQVDEKVAIELHFADGSKQTVTATVRDAKEMHHHKHHM